jgi:hypothetical protein
VVVLVQLHYFNLLSSVYYHNYKLCDNMYQNTHTSTRKRVEFTLDSMAIFDMEDNSKIVVGEIDHKSRLYTFSEFVAKLDSTSLLTHFNDDSNIWH